MAKFANDLVMDAALKFVSGSADKISVCADEPASFADATTPTGSGGKMLATGSIGPGDFTITNGDSSGRKVTIASQTGLSVQADGSANHVALVDTGNSRLLVVTTAPSQSVSSGGTVDTNAWDEEIGDPT